jgi:hypothetical protein
VPFCASEVKQRLALRWDLKSGAMLLCNRRARVVKNFLRKFIPDQIPSLAHTGFFLK